MTTDPGDVFADIFAGGGAGGIAAKQLDREYIGADIDKDYVAVANERIVATKPIIRNGVYVSMHLGKIVSIRDKDIIEKKNNVVV